MRSCTQRGYEKDLYKVARIRKRKYRDLRIVKWVKDGIRRF